MDDDTLRKVKNTLVVILKERNEARALAVLGVASRWAVEDAHVETYRDDETDYLTANVFLPAEAYARVPERARSTIEEVVRKTLNEVTKLHGCQFSSLAIGPELVETLTFTQEELTKWLPEAFKRDQEAESVGHDDDWGPPDSGPPF